MSQLHIIPHQHEIGLEDRIKRNGHRPLLVWLTGLSGSGKSTIANELEKRLYKEGISTYILDGDNIRAGLNKDLDFSDESRVENIRRIGEVARLFVDAGSVVITAFISPFDAERKMVKELLGEDYYFLVHVDCPLEECEKRDVKGLYAKARKGEIKQFTGIDSPFEIPSEPNLTINTANDDLSTCVSQVFSAVVQKIKR